MITPINLKFHFGKCADPDEIAQKLTLNTFDRLPCREVNVRTPEITIVSFGGSAGAITDLIKRDMGKTHTVSMSENTDHFYDGVDAIEAPDDYHFDIVPK